MKTNKIKMTRWATKLYQNLLKIFLLKYQIFKLLLWWKSTILKLTPNQDVKHKMLTEINLTALVSIDKNFQDKKELEKIILVKIPAEVYPTLYETFIYDRIRKNRMGNFKFNEWYCYIRFLLIIAVNQWSFFQKINVC